MRPIPFSGRHFNLQNVNKDNCYIADDSFSDLDGTAVIFIVVASGEWLAARNISVGVSEAL